MGSKLSKAGRRSHDAHEARAPPTLPEVKTVSPLLVHFDTVVSTPSLHLTEAAISNDIIMDEAPAQPPHQYEIYRYPPEPIVDTTASSVSDNASNPFEIHPLIQLDSNVSASPPLIGPTSVAPPAPIPLPQIPCIICLDKFDKAQLVHPHAHDEDCPICTNCLKGMFLAATKDTSRMPPRCCQQVPLHVVRPYLTDAEAEAFRNKYDEWSTPNPFYCPVPNCSAFIPLRILQQARRGKERRADSVVGTPTSPYMSCPSCHTAICTNCRNLAHGDAECHKLEFGVDEETAELLKSWGYKRCPKCGNGVRRMFGCNHMECLCGAHWCWSCQRKRDDCSGGCYDEEEESDDEDYEEQQQQELANPPAEASTAPITAGAQQTDQPSTPQPPRRPRNLDAHGPEYWEDRGINFGEEPTNEVQDTAWHCLHAFRILKLPFQSLKHTHTRNMECTRCWTPIHPELVLPQKLDTGKIRLVAGTAGGGAAVRARRMGMRGRGVGRRWSAAPGRAGIVLRRADATIGTLEMWESVPSSYSEPAFEPLRSENGDVVMDTYSNILQSNDFILNPPLPRRKSFDFSVEPSLKFDAEASDGEAGTQEQEKFSFAHECVSCAIIVCEGCKEELDALSRLV